MVTKMIIKRESAIVKTSFISIITNVILASAKAIVGLMAHSIAIISDSLNNFSDAISSIVTIIGTKMAGKKPDKEHPYGHGRIEYIASFVVAAIIMYAGLTALIESVKKIIHPVAINYSFATVIVVLMAILTKVFLALYIKNKGHEYKSDSLVASGTDALNDALISISLLISIVLHLVFKLNLEGLIGIFVSFYILWSGYELIKKSVDNLLGKRIEGKLSKNIKEEILKYKEVNGVFDLILNNYGPDNYFGSVHIEVPDTLTVAKVDKLSRSISKTILEKYGVILHTIGVYSVNTKSKKIIDIQNDINKIVFSHKGVLEMHGFYYDVENKSISLDIIIDFKVKKREELHAHICDEIRKKYPDYNVIINLDVDMSD